MTTMTPVALARNRLGVAVRVHGPDSPAAAAARRDFTIEKLAAVIAREMDKPAEFARTMATIMVDGRLRELINGTLGEVTS